MGLKELVHKASKKKIKLRATITGFAGSGKTWSALELASGLGERILLIDTERRSAELYANHFNFDHLPLDPPYSPERYIEAVQIGENGDYDVVIVDSLSHAWIGSGGILDIKTKVAQASSSKNEFLAWGQVTPQHNRLIDMIFNRNSPVHLIATMRSKMDYEISKDDRGRTVITRIGTVAVQRENLAFEFDLIFDISQDHLASVNYKDRTGFLFGREPFLITKALGAELLTWLDAGEEVIKPEAKTKEVIIAEMAELTTIKSLVSWNELNVGYIESLSDEDKSAVVNYRAERKAILIGGVNNGTARDAD